MFIAGILVCLAMFILAKRLGKPDQVSSAFDSDGGQTYEPASA
jgi:hypothetical protein